MLVALTVLAGYAVVLEPRMLAGALAAAVVLVCANNVKVARLLLVIVVALLPFHAFLSANGLVPWWKEALLALLLASVVLREGIRANPMILPTGLFIACVLLAAALGGRFGSYDLSPYLAYLPLVLIIPSLATSPRHLNMLIAVVLASGLINAGVVIYGSVSGVDLFESYGDESPFLGTQRASSFAGPSLVTSTLLGALAAGSLAGLLTRGAERSSTSVIRGAAAVAVFASASILSLTRGAVVSLAVALVLTPVLTTLRAQGSRASRVKASGVLIVSMLAIVGLGALVTTESSYKERLSIFSGSTASADSTRADRWEETLEIALRSPVAGEGPGFTGLSRIRETLGPDANYFPAYLPVPVSESNLLKVFAEVGLLGVLAAVWLFFVAARELWRAAAVHRTALIMLVVLVAMATRGLFYQTMESYIGAALFWGAVGIAAAFGRFAGAPAERQAL